MNDALLLAPTDPASRPQYWRRLTAIPYAVTLVALNTAIGLTFLLESPNRTVGPAYHAALLLPFPVKAWGWGFIAVAVLVAASNGRRWALQAGCLIGVFVWIFWAAMLGISAYETGESSYRGIILYTAGAIRCWQVIAIPDMWRRLWRRLRPCSG